MYGYTPPPLASTSYPVIAPYWADVDTRASGAMYYRESVEPNLLAIANEYVSNYQYMLYGSTDFQVESLLIVTWGNVGYFNYHSDKV